MIRETDMAPSPGPIKQSTKETGKTTSHMVKESLHTPQETITKESGTNQKHKDRVNSLKSMEIYTKDNGKTTNLLVWALKQQ